MKKDKYTAVIIDDEKDSINVLQKLLTNFNEISVVETANNGIDGEYLISKHQPDIAFVDIDMPGKNGVELLRDIHNVQNNTKVIFTTAHEEYAIDSIKYHPFGYLLKPVGLSQLKEVICHVNNDEKHIQENNFSPDNNSNKLKVSSKQEVRFIDFDKIAYLRADGNYTDLKLTSRESLNVSLQLGVLEKKLPHERFIRINRSEIINIELIDKIKRNNKQLTISFSGEVEKFFISKSKAKEIEASIS